MTRDKTLFLFSPFRTLLHIFSLRWHKPIEEGYFYALFFWCHSLTQSRCPIKKETLLVKLNKNFTGGSGSKESACSAGDLGSIPGLGRSTGEGNGYPLQYSGLENSKDRGAWQATIHGIAKRRMRLSDFHFSLSKKYNLHPYELKYVIQSKKQS